VVSVDATDPNPAFAATLANTFAEQYIRFRRDADRSKVNSALKLVQTQLARGSPAELAGTQGRDLRKQAEQLKVLAALQTGNAELVQQASAPSSPSSPKTMRDVGLSFLIGLLLGTGLAFLFDRLDRRLRDPQEVKDTFQRPILGVIPASRTLPTTGPGRSGPLPVGEEESFRMLRANLRYFNVDHPIRSVLITSAAPGEGKSTVAWNLAAAAASTGSPVLLVEADLRHPSLAASENNLRPRPGLSDVLAGQANVENAVQATPIPARAPDGKARETMDVLVAGALPPNPDDLLESERMQAILESASSRYELVILDTPPTSVVSDAVPLIREVDGVIVVTRIGTTTREAAVELRSQLEDLGAPILGVVVNAVRARVAGYGYGYKYAPASGNGKETDAETAEKTTVAAVSRDLGVEPTPRQVRRPASRPQRATAIPSQPGSDGAPTAAQSGLANGAGAPVPEQDRRQSGGLVGLFRSAVKNRRP
jgi:capsular exopolysaccharide synthesis family protein